MLLPALDEAGGWEHWKYFATGVDMIRFLMCRLRLGALFVLPLQADLTGLAMEQAGCHGVHLDVRCRRDEARLRLTLVCDAERLASHHGGPERRLPRDGGEVAKLRVELEQMRAEIGALKAEMHSGKAKAEAERIATAKAEEGCVAAEELRPSPSQW